MRFRAGLGFGRPDQRSIPWEREYQHRSRSAKPFAISSRGDLSSANTRTEPIKLSAQSILEEVLEAENRDVFGREYYEHGVEPD